MSLRGALVVAEIGLAMVLLAGGGLLIRSFAKLSSVDAGYDPSNVVTFQVAAPGRSLSAGEDEGIRRRTGRETSVDAGRRERRVRQSVADGQSGELVSRSRSTSVATPAARPPAGAAAARTPRTFVS